MKKIKVAFFADILISDFDGAVRTMFQLINRIPDGQFDFLFVCGTGPGSIRGFRCLRLPAVSIPGNSRYRCATPLLKKMELDKALDTFSPDIIHVASPSLLGDYALKAARRLGIPVISIYHTHFISYVAYYVRKIPFLTDFTKQKVSEALKSFYNRCDLVYVPSASILRELQAQGFHPERMKLWTRGIDRKLFSPDRRNPQLMQSLTGNGRPCILFASRLVWEKNLQTLIALYRLAGRQHPEYNLIVAGEGVARRAVERQMPRATFLGHVGHERLAELYASADVFFFPSVSETFGNVVLEAMASGLPCVIADSGGSKDFIRHGENGFTCAPCNAADYLERIHQIIRHPALAGQFAEKGLETSRRYVWENLASIYFDDLKCLSSNRLAV
jgi:glycosyltransferase involved in cell wall biosynthesis